MANIRLFSLLTFICLLFQSLLQAEVQTIYFPQSPHAVVQLPPLNASDVTIIFDLHNTLIKRNRTEMAKHLASGTGIKFMTKLVGEKIGFTTELKEFNDLVKQKVSAEGLYEKYKDSNPKLAQLILDLATTYEPISGMIDIVKDLKLEGYSLVLASNISPMMLHRTCAEKQSINYMLSYFDQRQVVSYTGVDQVIDIETYPGIKVSTVPYTKVHKEFFGAMQERLTLTPSMIYIDDDLDAVKMAVETLGAIGIYYQTPKQLRKDLQTLMLLEKIKN